MATGSTSFSRSLRARAILILLGAVVVAAGIAAIAFRTVFGSAADEDVQRRGHYLVRTLSQHQGLRLALSLKDATGAKRVADEARQGDDDVHHVLVFDGADQLLGESDRDGSKALDAEQLKALSSGAGLRLGDVFFVVQAVERSGGEAKKAGGELDFDSGGDEPKDQGKNLGKVAVGISSAATRGRLLGQTAITITATALVLVVAFLVFFAGIVRRLNIMVAFAERVTSGELTADLKPDGADEIGRLMQAIAEMTLRMGSMVSKLQETSRALTQASGEILSSSTHQSQSAARQASSVAQTGATVAELRATFTQTTERAQAVIDLAKKSEESSSSGRAAVQESVAAMEELRDQVLATSRTILELVDRTAQIGTIIDAVNDLAEQSNVLALNAAIEAAKAGEHGRGFAVVAREVRSLAERSKDSTGQVRSILGDIERATRQAMTVIEEGTRKAAVSMELATRAGQSIALLNSAIDESSGAARQIANSLRQQSVGVDQIWEAMREIDRAVKTTVEGIQQLENASRSMKGMSEQVSSLVTNYRTRAEA
ncbi:MAG: methyl-accepting chemotaxis protein [Deltaproteobacteria bacterium]|nr:methyl-accepting chemotaxis protein [Deltaproteobacteria bacterium]